MEASWCTRLEALAPLLEAVEASEWDAQKLPRHSLGFPELMRKEELDLLAEIFTATHLIVQGKQASLRLKQPEWETLCAQLLTVPE